MVSKLKVSYYGARVGAKQGQSSAPETEHVIRYIRRHTFAVNLHLICTYKVGHCRLVSRRSDANTKASCLHTAVGLAKYEFALILLLFTRF